MLDARYWMLDADADAGCWMRILDAKPDLRLLAAGHLSLMTDHWPLVTGHSIRFFSFLTSWLLAFWLVSLLASRPPGFLAFWLRTFLILVFLTFISMRHKIF
jgi:hypothetical protein